MLTSQRNIAIVPFITYTAGFIFSLLCKFKRVNSKVSSLTLVVYFPFTKLFSVDR